MKLERFEKFMLELEPQEFVDFVNGEINQNFKKEVDNQWGKEFFDKEVFEHLENTIAKGRYYHSGIDYSNKMAPYRRADFKTYDQYLKIENKDYKQHIAHLVLNQIIKKAFEERPNGKSRYEMIDLCFDYLTKRKNIFDNELLEAYVSQYIVFLEKVASMPFVYNTIVPAYIPHSYPYLDTIDLEDLQMLNKMASFIKDTYTIEKFILQKKQRVNERIEDINRLKLYEFSLYQKNLIKFAKTYNISNLNKFAQKILQEYNNHPLNLMVELVYNTPELSENLKDKFKQIIKEENYEMYEKLEKKIIANQQKQQKKVERQEIIAKIMKKLPFANKTLLKQEKQTQETTQGKE